jgi:hypothetical protein
MRKVFTSPRLENVEAVATLLRDAGIEVKITEPRSYRGSRRSSFTYRESEEAAPQPAVWIVRADDQPRGRQLLREAGLLDSARGESSYLPLSVLERDKDSAATAKARRALRIKLGLLVLILVVVGLVFFTTRKPAPAPAIAAPVARHPAPVIVPQAADDMPTYRADVPTALAALLVEADLAASAPAQACIAIDDKDPSPVFMQALRHGAGTAVFVASQCPGENARDINVHDYMTDGSGSGVVQLMLDLDDAQVLDVEREGGRWRVVRTR